MIRLFGDDSGRLEAFRSIVDADRLKRVGVVTYFSVYLAIALGGWQRLVALTQQLPALVRPPALSQLHVLLGLPRSVAWGLVSLSVTFLTVGLVVSVQCYRSRSDAPPSLADISGRSWRDRVPTVRDIRGGLSGRARVRDRLPAAPALENQLPDAPGLPPVRPPGGGDPDIRVCDASLAVPVASLSLPQSGPGTRRPPIMVPESHAVAEGVPGLAAGPVSGADADGSERADGGPGVPVPDVLDPEETLGRATPGECIGRRDAPAETGATEESGDTMMDAADGGENAVEGPDAEVAWPDGWRRGDEL
ncbi:hypothetical protein [Haloglomus salinum]|uniref:hypothetical protein n=1 Tax=Haloglomus salinum TaxID=2962673 RepID=UPI0020CA263B|nr:hypothetical protein [Haloglomus salinum]